MDLVVEHVLAEGAAEHGLHRVLRHGVHAQPVDVGIAVLAVGTLVHLWGTQPPPGSLFSSHGNRVCPTPARPRLHSPSRSPQVSEMLSHSTAPPGLTCSGLVSSDVFGRFEERGDSELPGKEMRLEVAGESVSSFSAWLDDAGRKSGRCNPAARPGQPPEGACWVRVKIHS